MNCFACGRKLTPVISDERLCPAEVTWQFENALVLIFQGGYGMFFDDLGDTEARRAVLCHGCAHSLCEKNPWMASLAEPDTGHCHNDY